jgi:hypothetical protein
MDEPFGMGHYRKALSGLSSLSFTTRISFVCERITGYFLLISGVNVVVFQTAKVVANTIEHKSISGNS